MHHPTFAVAATDFRRHVHETVYFPPHVPPLNIPPILAPFTAEDTPLRRLLPQWRNRIPHKWQLSSRFWAGRGYRAVVHPGAETGAGGVGDVEERRVDDADYGDVVEG